MQYAKKANAHIVNLSDVTHCSPHSISKKDDHEQKENIFVALVIAVVAVVAIFALISQKEKEMNPEEFLERFEKAAEEVLGEDIQQFSKTELVVTLTYGHETDKDNNIIYYRILKTTYGEAGDQSSVTGLNTDALNVLFPVDMMDSCEEMMIQDWYGALYKKDDTAYLCWTCDPEVTYVLEYTPSKMPDSEIIKMAESAEPVE